jgi:HEAT repeat protein
LAITVERIELAADRLQWARWFSPPEIQASPSMDLRILIAAFGAPGPGSTSTSISAGATNAAALRRVAVRALGRMENPRDLVTIAQLLADPDATVRAMAARDATRAQRAPNAAEHPGRRRHHDSWRGDDDLVSWPPPADDPDPALSSASSACRY